MIARAEISLAEKQVLFRIDGKLLEALDRKITRDGYSTRNAWFKEVVSGYAGRARGAAKARKAPAKKAKARGRRAR